MSTIKSQHRRAVGIVTIHPPAVEGGKPRKVWRYTMSLKNFARECTARGNGVAIGWMGNKRIRIPRLDEVERGYRLDRAAESTVHGS